MAIEEMSEGAKRAAAQLTRILELMKDQNERLTVLEKHMVGVLDRMEQNETSWLELSEKIAKSTITIDQSPSGLGMN